MDKKFLDMIGITFDMPRWKAYLYLLAYAALSGVCAYIFYIMLFTVLVILAP